MPSDARGVCLSGARALGLASHSRLKAKLALQSPVHLSEEVDQLERLRSFNPRAAPSGGVPAASVFTA
jgi:hypothetical protein